MPPIGYQKMVEEARDEIENMPLEDALEAHAADGNDVVFVDIRDVRELGREGMIPGAFHAPRGMLEFWIDPESPYHKDVFASGKKLIFYCNTSWRSALATQTAQRMGLASVAHIDGGFTAWKAGGGPVVERTRK